MQVKDLRNWMTAINELVEAQGMCIRSLELAVFPDRKPQPKKSKKSKKSKENKDV